METIGLTAVIWWREHCFKQNPANRLPRIYIPLSRVNMPPGYSLRAKLFGYGPGRLPHRALRLPGHPLRGDAGEHRGAFARRDHTPCRWRPGPTGAPRAGGYDSVWHPWGRPWRPDRLLGRTRGRQTVRVALGPLPLHHPCEVGTRRGVLREARGQGRLPGALLLRLARLRSPGRRHKPDALGDLPDLQRPGWGRVGDGGGPSGLLPREQPRARGALAGTGHAGARRGARRGGRLLLGLPLGFAQQGAARGVGRSAADLPHGGPLEEALRRPA